MDEEWDSNIEATVLPLIWKNVLTLDEANEIANQTAIDHPLCYLYKRGLIGVVEMSDTGRLMQVFQRAAVANEGNRSSMPVSAAYLVHPLLESRILNARANASKGKFQLVPGMVVGNGLKWNPSARTKQVSIKLKSGRVVLLINRTDLSASISETVSGSFTTLAEVPTSMLIACLLAMLEENTNTPSIQDVLDKMKEFIDAGYLSQKKKSKGQVVLMMTYLSECLKGERYPTLFETINDRLTAIGLVETKITRFKKTSAMAVTGFSWNEIELIME